MERFFIFDKFNTWYNWRLILTAKDVTPPEPKTNYVDIDGMNGSLDLSESLTGEITYKDRTISASFWTDNGSFKDRSDLLREIVTALHGKKIKIIEPDDPKHYFYGRVNVKALNNILPYATFTIEATCEPWRYSIADIERTIDIKNNDMVNVVINNRGVKTVIPTITVKGSINIIVNNTKLTLIDGVYKFSDFKFYRGVNVVDISGNGSVTFTYKEAEL